MHVVSYMIAIEKKHCTGMEQIVQLVRTQCRFDTWGGRLEVSPDMQTCTIWDVSTFPDSLLKQLGEMGRVEIHADRCSLSGFTVKVKLNKKKKFRALATGILMACMGAVIAHCLKEELRI